MLENSAHALTTNNCEYIEELQINQLLQNSKNPHPSQLIEAYYLSGETLTGLCLASDINDRFLIGLGHWLAFGDTTFIKSYIKQYPQFDNNDDFIRYRDLILYSYFRGKIKNSFSELTPKLKSLLVQTLETNGSKEDITNSLCLDLLKRRPHSEILENYTFQIKQLPAKYQLLCTSCLLKIARSTSSNLYSENLKIKYQQLSLIASHGKTDDVFYLLQSFRHDGAGVPYSLYGRGKELVSFSHKILLILGAKRCTTLLFSKNSARLKVTDSEKSKLYSLLLEVLNSLRGPLMKVGQIIGSHNFGQDSELRKLLLEINSPRKPIPFYLIKQQIENSLKVPLFTLFKRFENEPVGIGSLSQVHRAELKDGRIVAVKILYPRIFDIIKSDFKYLRLAYPLLKLLAPHLDTLSYIRELENSMLAECNLLKEAEAQEFFKKPMLTKKVSSFLLL